MGDLTQQDVDGIIEEKNRLVRENYQLRAKMARLIGTCKETLECLSLKRDAAHDICVLRSLRVAINDAEVP